MGEREERVVMKYIPYEIKTGAENMQIDCDLLENAIEQHSELIEQRIEERVNKRNVTITKENAQQVLEQLMQVLGNEEKGFYSSRLKQCINKLKAVA